MITISGTRIEPLSKFNGKFAGTPNILDIALGLSRAARFGGHTRCWWSVLLHSILCCELAIGQDRGVEGEEVSRRKIALCLLHDAHEAITADVPAFFKTSGMKMHQADLDERIFKQFNLWPVSEEEAAFVKMIDDMALRAEALAFGPPTIMQHLSLPKNSHYAQALQIQARFPDANSCEGLGSKGVREFLDRFAELYRDIAADICDDTPSNQATS